MITSSSVLSYPEMFSLSTGKTITESSPKQVTQSLALLYQSSEYELLGDPNYGTRLMAILEDYNDNILVNDIKDTIITATRKYKPEIEISEEDIDITVDDDYTYINFQYRIVNSDHVGQFEFKFERSDTSNE